MSDRCFIRSAYRAGTDAVTGKNRDLQRSTVPYARLLGITEAETQQEGDDAMAL